MSRSKSIKTIMLTFEAIGLILLISILTVAILIFQKQLNKQTMNQLQGTMETVEHSTLAYLSDQSKKFVELSKEPNPATASRYFNQFADLYFVDSENKITEIIRVNPSSHIFVGYGIDIGVLANFLKESNSDGVQISPILRSVESDSVSIYFSMMVNDRRLIARIELETLIQYLKQTADSFDSIIIIASGNGYIMTSTQSELPFKIVPSQDAIQVSLKEKYFLTKYDSPILNNTIVLLTPLNQINGPMDSLRLFVPILFLALFTSFMAKIYVQNQFFLKPIQVFINRLQDYNPNNREVIFEAPILHTKEVKQLYNTFQEKTKEIELSFENLNIQREKAMSQLIESEKMTSLGGLVAGVAHEINTPIGVCISATSYLKSNNDQILKALNDGELKKTKLQTYLTDLDEAIKIISVSLERSSELVKSFKQIAVAQSSDNEIIFDFEEQIQIVLSSLKHEYKRGNHQFHVSCPANFQLLSHPGAFHQIFTNLIMNAVIHGFKEKEQGEGWITVTQQANMLEIEFKDNGVGIPLASERRVFEPFFTTNRQSGGSGLGLHIVFNIVTQKFNGTISIEHEDGFGAIFKISLPIELISNNIWRISDKF